MWLRSCDKVIVRDFKICALTVVKPVKIQVHVQTLFSFFFFLIKMFKLYLYNEKVYFQSLLKKKKKKKKKKKERKKRKEFCELRA